MNLNDTKKCLLKKHDIDDDFQLSHSKVLKRDNSEIETSTKSCEKIESTELESKDNKKRKILVRGSALSSILKDTVRSRERMDATERRLAQAKLCELNDKPSKSIQETEAGNNPVIKTTK